VLDERFVEVSPFNMLLKITNMNQIKEENEMILEMTDGWRNGFSVKVESSPLFRVEAVVLITRVVCVDGDMRIRRDRLGNVMVVSGGDGKRLLSNINYVALFNE
jgi:hypothetical protein